MTLFTTQNGLQVMIVNHISTNSSAITLTTLHLRETISSASALLFLAQLPISDDDSLSF